MEPEEAVEEEEEEEEEAEEEEEEKVGRGMTSSDHQRISCVAGDVKKPVSASTNQSHGIESAFYLTHGTFFP